jgi:hypothetical protein
MGRKKHTTLFKRVGVRKTLGYCYDADPALTVRLNKKNDNSTIAVLKIFPEKKESIR